MISKGVYDLNSNIAFNTTMKSVRESHDHARARRAHALKYNTKVDLEPCPSEMIGQRHLSGRKQVLGFDLRKHTFHHELSTQEATSLGTFRS